MYASFVFFYRLGKHARELCIIINNITYVIFLQVSRPHMPQLPTCKMQLDYVHVDTLHIYVHMQLIYVGIQNTGTYER